METIFIKYGFFTEHFYARCNIFDVAVTFRTDDGIKTGRIVRFYDSSGPHTRTAPRGDFGTAFNTHPVEALSIYSESDGLQWNDDEGRETGITWLVYPSQLIDLESLIKVDTH